MRILLLLVKTCCGIESWALLKQCLLPSNPSFFLFMLRAVCDSVWEAAMLNVSILLAVDVEWWLPVLLNCSYNFCPCRSFVPDTPSVHRVGVICNVRGVQSCGRTHQVFLSCRSGEKGDASWSCVESNLNRGYFFFPFMCLSFVLCASWITRGYCFQLESSPRLWNFACFTKKSGEGFFKAELALKSKTWMLHTLVLICLFFSVIEKTAHSKQGLGHKRTNARANHTTLTEKKCTL